MASSTETALAQRIFGVGQTLSKASEALSKTNATATPRARRHLSVEDAGGI